MNNRRSTLGDFRGELETEIAVGPGWRKCVSELMVHLKNEGVIPSRVWSRDGALIVHGKGVDDEAAAAIIDSYAKKLNGMCEFCWLGGTSKTRRNGRCDNHREAFPHSQHDESPGGRGLRQ